MDDKDLIIDRLRRENERYRKGDLSVWRKWENEKPSPNDEILVKVSPHWRGNVNSYIYDIAKILMHVIYRSDGDEGYLEMFHGPKIKVKWRYAFDAEWVSVKDLGCRTIEFENGR